MDRPIFPEIICQDGKWFLRVVYSTNEVKEICLPNYPMMNRIWEAASDLLEMYVDDAGGNEYNIELLRKISKAFAGISQLLSDEAKQQELDKLYEYDENEPWYQR